MSTRSGKRAYSASTSSGGVDGPSAIRGMVRSCVARRRGIERYRRELDLEMGATGRIAVLRREHGTAARRVRDAATHEHRRTGRDAEQLRVARVDRIGIDR